MNGEGLCPFVRPLEMYDTGGVGSGVGGGLLGRQRCLREKCELWVPEWTGDVAVCPMPLTIETVTLPAHCGLVKR